jgi:hypothetical protein
VAGVPDPVESSELPVTEQGFDQVFLDSTGVGGPIGSSLQGEYQFCPTASTPTALSKPSVSIRLAPARPGVGAEAIRHWRGPQESRDSATGARDLFGNRASI